MDHRPFSEAGPVVSVVLPTRDRAHLLMQSVRSVLDQTYPDFELIIVDDASADETEEVIRQLASEKVEFLRHPFVRGAAAARNSGIRMARGKYVAFLDSDDEWLPGKLERQVEVMEHSPAEVGLVYTGTWREYRKKRFYIPAEPILQKEGWVYPILLRDRYLVPTPAAMVRKECFTRVGVFDENLPAKEEWDLWIRISRQYQFRYIPEPLVISHFTRESLSADRRLFIQANMYILKKHRREFLKNRNALIGIYLRTARLWAGYVLHTLGII
ncbi:MAG: glycosyltransferase family 2 protein [Candidatus Aminicenantales bacterium]